MNLHQNEIIDSYRVVRLLGHGGMGAVYEVEHVELGVHYALKTFTYDSVADYGAMLRTKFIEEGKILARLKHPNIVRVFGLAHDEKRGILYYVMDLVLYKDGQSWTFNDVNLESLDEEFVYPRENRRPLHQTPIRWVFS